MGFVPLGEETPECCLLPLSPSVSISPLPLPTSPLPLPHAQRDHVRAQREDAADEPGRGLSAGTTLAGTLISVCPDSRTVINKHLLSKPPSLWCWATAALLLRVHSPAPTSPASLLHLTPDPGCSVCHPTSSPHVSPHLHDSCPELRFLLQLGVPWDALPSCPSRLCHFPVRAMHNVSHSAHHSLSQVAACSCLPT